MSLDHLLELARLAETSATILQTAVAEYVAMVRLALRNGRTVFFAGNGGSAAHAQHVATEYVVRYRKVRRSAVPALALSADSVLVTAGANDLGFEEVFARQVEAHAQSGDLLVVVSTSGNSANLLRAVQTAKTRGVTTVGLLACSGGSLASLVDLAIVVPTHDTALAQEIQLAVDHHVCAVVEAGLQTVT